jgi:hypothetical protein
VDKPGAPIDPHQVVISSVVLGVLNFVFISFIAIQLMFLFGGHDIIKRYDITYADYVHQGFGQMAFIAALVMGIGYVIFRLNKASKLNAPKVLTVLLVAQTMIIAASALKRLFLYQDAYGLTQLRFLVWHFVVYVGLLLLTLAVVILVRSHYRNFVKIGFGISVLYLMFMTGVNMDAHIAKVNIDRYVKAATSGKIDTGYFMALSVDAYTQMLRLKNSTDPTLVHTFERWKDLSKAAFYWQPGSSSYDEHAWSWLSLSASKFRFTTGEGLTWCEVNDCTSNPRLNLNSIGNE